MKLGIFTLVFGNLSADQMLVEVRRYEKVSAIELGTGGWPGASHVDVDGLLTNRDSLHESQHRAPLSVLEMRTACIVRLQRMDSPEPDGIPE